MDEWERDDDYEYGYDYLYEENEKRPADAAEDADEPDDDTWWDDESDEAVERRLADTREVDVEESAYWQDDEAPDNTAADLSVEAVLKDIPIPAEPEPQAEAEQERHKLKREIKAEALTRLEEAARTAADFRQVTAMWDKLDANRERRERYHEIPRGDVPLDVDVDYANTMIFPRWKNDPTERQLASGFFLDYLADCPYEMHNLTGKRYLCHIVDRMWEAHKEIIFFLYLRLYSPQRLAAIRGQTDRNIRKVRDTALRRLRQEVYEELKERDESGRSMDAMERDFYCHYQELEEASQK